MNQVTIFPDHFGKRMSPPRVMTLGEIERVITSAEPAQDKHSCQMLKLATFGAKKTDRDSLRFDENVTHVHGVEIDYDGEKMPMADAVALLRDAGLQALLYTSASHTPQKPRWRVLCMLAKSIAGTPTELRHKRKHLTGVVNAVLGGVAKGESFALSQAYYFGRIAGKPDPEVVRLDAGVCVDELANPPAPIFPLNGSDPQQHTESEGTGEHAPEDESKDLYGRVHRDVAARMRDYEIVARHWTHPHVAKARTDSDKRRAIERCIAKARAALKRPDAPAAVVEAEPHFNPTRSIITLDALTVRPPEPVFIFDKLLPLDVGQMVGAGGAAKSTLTIKEAVHIALGLPLFGHELLRDGKVLFVSAEDSRARFQRRLHHVCEAMQLTLQQQERVVANVLFEDITGRGLRFVASDREGNLTQTAVVEQLIAAYCGKGVVLVNIDPMVYLGPGERFVNDGEAAMMQVAHRICAGLGAAVRYVHHTGKAQAREAQADQYGGRGGSAGADGSRFVQVLHRYDSREKAPGAPAEFLPVDYAKGRVLGLSVPKLTDAPALIEPIWIRRQGWSFEFVTADTSTKAAVDERDVRTLAAWVEAERGKGGWPTGATIVNAKNELGLTRDRVRRVIDLALRDGMLVELPLPKDQVHGQKTHYYDVPEGLL